MCCINIYRYPYRTRDQIVMVNGVSMENTTSQYTIQHLKSCGKTANIVSPTTLKPLLHKLVCKLWCLVFFCNKIVCSTWKATEGQNCSYWWKNSYSFCCLLQTVKRPRTVQVPASGRPTRASSQSNLLDNDRYERKPRRESDSGYGRRPRSATPEHNGHNLALMSGYKRLPNQDAPEKPIRATLVKLKPTDGEGMSHRATFRMEGWILLIPLEHPPLILGPGVTPVIVDIVLFLSREGRGYSRNNVKNLYCNGFRWHPCILWFFFRIILYS